MKKKLPIMLLVTLYAIQVLLLYILSPFLLFMNTENPPLTCKQLLSHCFIGAFDCINYYEYRDRVFRTETPKQQHSKKSFGYGNGI